jgi:HPt (histidine-containing phosphotransfer) domain-containing protein
LDEIAITNRAKTTGPLDPRVLAEIAEIQRKGRPGFVQRVIALYLQTAAELIKELEAASVKNEPGILYRASHTLKPCSAAVGALSLAALCEALESATGMAPSPIRHPVLRRLRTNTSASKRLFAGTLYSENYQLESS